MKNSMFQFYKEELDRLKQTGNFRSFSSAVHQGKYMEQNGVPMLNLSSNDYLGIATDISLREEFLNTLSSECFIPSASSSRLLTGNYAVYEEVENLLCQLFERESALVFTSGYHMNIGILPAVSDSNTLIIADKYVHASLIDGIRLSTAKYVRYRHNDYLHLEKILAKNHSLFSRCIIVTESIFSMDGDKADLVRLTRLKKRYPNVLLYVDEAHAVGACGKKGLGCAEEQECIKDIDFLTGTFGKALASVGGYLVCDQLIKDYLINKMRSLIFTTALPSINLAWTKFVLERLADFHSRRIKLKTLVDYLLKKTKEKQYDSVSESHIFPLIIGDSREALLKADEMQKNGFYVLPVRPPTVPEGTSRLRISLTSEITKENIDELMLCL